MQSTHSNLQIGLSWQGGSAEYGAYEAALLRRAAASGIQLTIAWLGGQDRPFLSSALPGLHGLCLTGGADVEPWRYGNADAAGVCHTDAVRDATEWALLEHVQRKPLPVLAICRGAQLLNAFHGGTLIPDLAERNAAHRAPPEKQHEVQIIAGTRLAEISGLDKAIVNSSHHQAVDVLAPRFSISARAADGTIEAFEARDHSEPFALAVQWHPEKMAQGLSLSDGVFDAFLAATQKHSGPARATR